MLGHLLGGFVSSKLMNDTGIMRYVGMILGTEPPDAMFMKGVDLVVAALDNPVIASQAPAMVDAALSESKVDAKKVYFAAEFLASKAGLDKPTNSKELVSLVESFARSISDSCIPLSKQVVVCPSCSFTHLA